MFIIIAVSDSQDIMNDFSESNEDEDINSDDINDLNNNKVMKKIIKKTRK